MKPILLRLTGTPAGATPTYQLAGIAGDDLEAFAERVYRGPTPSRIAAALPAGVAIAMDPEPQLLSDARLEQLVRLLASEIGGVLTLNLSDPDIVVADLYGDVEQFSRGLTTVVLRMGVPLETTPRLQAANAEEWTPDEVGHQRRWAIATHAGQTYNYVAGAARAAARPHP